jgi:transmembrane sensor
MTEELDPQNPALWDILARYVDGESPAEEAEAVRRWLAEEPARAELLAAVDSASRRVAFRAPADLDVEAALRDVKARLDEPPVVPFRAPVPKEPPSRAWRSNLLRVAAVALLLAGGALLWRTVAERNAPTVTAAQQVHRTGMGESQTVYLPDGTVVWMGPESRLTVAAGYGARARRVDLAGEALFDVVHDERRPFSVRAAHAEIQDLGTTFTVRSAAAEEVSVAVTVGAVRLSAADTPAFNVILRAGDRGVLPRGGRPVAQRGGARESDVAWTRGRLVFDNAPLTRVAEDLRRWYGIELRIADRGLADRHLTASFENESKEQVLRVIGLALGAQVERRGDTAVIRALPTGSQER